MTIGSCLIMLPLLRNITEPKIKFWKIMYFNVAARFILLSAACLTENKKQENSSTGTSYSSTPRITLIKDNTLLESKIKGENNYPVVL